MWHATSRLGCVALLLAALAACLLLAGRTEAATAPKGGTTPAATATAPKHDAAPPTTKELDAAKERLRRHSDERLKAAERAMDAVTTGGVSVADAEDIISTGIDSGLEPDDFDQLGKYVGELHSRGLKGTALADAIHVRIRERKLARDQARDQKRGRTTERDKTGPSDRTDVDKQTGRVEKDSGQGQGKGQSQGQGKGQSQGQGQGKGQGQNQNPGAGQSDKHNSSGQGQARGKDK